MTCSMERNKKTPLQFLLLPLLYASAFGSKCPSHPDKNLPCYSDYNKTITCTWHSPYEHDPHCTVHAEKSKGYFKYRSSCLLTPVDVSRPALKKCSIVFKKNRDEISSADPQFLWKDNVTIKLMCDHVKKNPVTSIFFTPYCHVKLDPPQKPEKNATTVTLSLVKKRKSIEHFNFHVQWKKEDQSWKEASEQREQNFQKQCGCNCTALLHERLIPGEDYEARARVMPVLEAVSEWSEWSPSASWVSHTERRTKPPPPPPDGSWVISVVVICSVLLALLLTVITLKSNQTVWIFFITKIKGQPIPNPALSSLKDMNFQSYLGPQLRTFFKPLEIASIEIATSVDDISPIKPEAELPEKMRNESCYESTNSSFSNPSYAHVCSAPPPPVSLLTFAGNLDPCAPDTPYGPVCCQSEDKDAAQKRQEVREKEVKLRELFSKDCNKGEPVLVVSDYERVEKHQMERSRLQSLDSGVGSGEEVSQESLEADSINMTEENQEEREMEKEKGVFERLFGGSVDICGKSSIQVCSDYERVQKLQPDSPELQNLNVNEIQEQLGLQESLEDTDESIESTNLLAPPCSLSSATAMSSSFDGAAFKPVLHCNILALMSSSRSMELSGDGYMPVRQEQS